MNRTCTHTHTVTWTYHIWAAENQRYRETTKGTRTKKDILHRENHILETQQAYILKLQTVIWKMGWTFLNLELYNKKYLENFRKNDFEPMKTEKMYFQQIASMSKVKEKIWCHVETLIRTKMKISRYTIWSPL